MITQQLSQTEANAAKELLYKMADDALIIGHRNSEWVGLGPVLEEDIAFASIAQDKLGHALALYGILHERLGEEHPDKLAFLRSEKDFKCCRFVEMPIGEYDFSLARHFLFDAAEALRFEALANSAFEPLKLVARKIRGEVRYHTLHANVWIKQLGKGNQESAARMQTALNECMPLALGIFETSPFEQELIASGIFSGEVALRERWLEVVEQTITAAGLVMPDANDIAPAFGGRKGYHTEHLRTLLAEMGEVIAAEPEAEW